MSPSVVKVMSQLQDFLIRARQKQAGPAQELTDVEEGFVLGLLVERPLGMFKGRNEIIFFLLGRCFLALIQLIDNLGTC